ncbi:MAG: N-6 DNA methylase [Patescibacteria group bacterium]
MSKNERITENMVRKKLEAVGITVQEGFLVEEQKSENPLVKKLLESASKSGNGAGKPEFLISNPNNKEFILIIECKADTKFHESSNRDQFKDYAIDGVLLYASYLSKEFNVIAVGVSGQFENELKIDAFLHPKGATDASSLKDTSEKPVLVKDIISWEQYIRYATYDENLVQAQKSELNKFSRDLHDYIRDYGKITEAQKPLLVSGILLALMEKGFKVAYPKYEGAELAQKTFQAVKDIIEMARLGVNQERKKNAIINAFRFIEDHPELQKVDRKRNESPLAHIVRDIDHEVKPFTQNHYDYDVIGNFYGEFIRYTGGDAQGLGIVLTPKHITELFADLAKLNKNSVVLDTCCGTGGFLISAMKKMTVDVSENEKKKILENSLIGVEQEPSMFALAVSNMILRGDGKTNLYQGSCFDEEIFNLVKNKATVGFINPPYSQKGDDLHEWNFVIQLLNALQKNAAGIVIVPMSLAIAKHPIREQLLKEHRLEAVMSMPNDLFYPIGVVPCIIVFTAHVPHNSDSHHESWFGYWKDDGFRKDRIEGRIPTNYWPEIRTKWLHSYRRLQTPGESVWRKVGAEDEWSAEAYLETDYSRLQSKDFISNVKKYIAYKLLNSDEEISSKPLLNDSNRVVDVSKWHSFLIKDLFDVSGTKTTQKRRLEEIGAGKYPYITTQSTNNGVEGFYDFYTEKGNVIVIDSAVAGFSSYQGENFTASDHVEKLTPQFKLNKYMGLFLQTVINLEQFRYSYGKKFNQEKIRNTETKLPVDTSGNPDWKFMEDFIKSLPYSSSI